jgi:Flp pilus assembly protein TadB
MARFDKYVKEEVRKEAKQQVEERKFTSLSLTERMVEDSPFFKYSALFGKYFFYIKPIRNLSILLARKLFGKLPNYEKDSEEEIKIAAGLTGAFYLSVILFLITFDKKSPTNSLIMLIIGIVSALVSANTIRRFLSLGEIGSVPINSQEVLSFLSWMVLLMESGMNLFNAIEYYTSQEKSNLSDLFSYSIEKVKTGEASLDKALGELSIEIQRNDLREILTLILQSKQQGVPIKDTLYAYFERYQSDLQSLAEKKGSSANQKATFMLTLEVFLLMVYFILAMVSSLTNFK